MNKKVFKAENIQQAIATIKDELGPDAMILSTRKIAKKPMDPYSKDYFEVEAAMASSTSQKPQKTETPKAHDDPDWIDDVRTDIADIKDMISLAGFGNGMHNMVCNHFESVGVLASLLRVGVSEGLASLMIQEASTRMVVDADLGEKLKSLKIYVMKQCLNRISVKDCFTDVNRTGIPHVASFVGPTGVGKTTTIAKLAALLTFQRKMRVGLISIDNYRVGALEQLKAYASIMGLPCARAFNSKDLSNALDRMRSLDVVLIDTAGHSHFDKQKIDDIMEMMRSDFRISTHLVLSVTAESIIMEDAAAAFSVFNPDTLVFTKIDETKRCGKILDQLNRISLPVSLITNGQRVPEDLIVPDKNKLLKIILGKGPKGSQ